MSAPAFEYRQLSIAERLQLAADIWGSIAEEAGGAPGALPLTEAQRTELRRRREAHRQDPGAAIPWERVREELFGRGG